MVAARSDEFSCSAILYGDAALHVSYTCRRQRICYRRLPLADLE